MNRPFSRATYSFVVAHHTHVKTQLPPSTLFQSARAFIKDPHTCRFSSLQSVGDFFPKIATDFLALPLFTVRVRQDEVFPGEKTQEMRQS